MPVRHPPDAVLQGHFEAHERLGLPTLLPERARHGRCGIRAMSPSVSRATAQESAITPMSLWFPGRGGGWSRRRRRVGGRKVSGNRTRETGAVNRRELNYTQRDLIKAERERPPIVRPPLCYGLSGSCTSTKRSEPLRVDRMELPSARRCNRKRLRALPAKPKCREKRRAIAYRFRR